MNKNEFITAMEQRLIRLPKADRDDILSDYEAHFARGLEAGRTEEEVCASLGNPDELAATYLENLPENAKGAPYIPSEPAQDAQTQHSQPADSAQSSIPRYHAPTYCSDEAAAQNTAASGAYTQPTGSSSVDKTGAIVIVVVLSLFVALPILGSLISAVGSIIGFSVACIGLGVTAIVGGSAAVALSVTAGIGIILLSIAMFALAALLIVGSVAAIKGVVWLVKWYVGVCKKIIGGEI